MSPVETFCWGFAGSAAVQVVYFVDYFDKRPTDISPCYYSAGYWILRFLLAVVAGGLAVAYEAPKPLVAMSVGASAPLILSALARGLKPPTGH